MTGPDRGEGATALWAATGLGLAAALATVVLLLAAMPQALVLGVLLFATSTSLVALVLALRTARHERRRARAFRELLAQAAHQLRTPTATLVMELDAALADPALAAGGRALAERLSTQAAAQDDLVTRLLASARLDARAPVPVACDVERLLDDARRVLDPLAHAHDTTLHTAATVPTITGDAHELRELVVILTENAIRHGGDDVRVTIEAAGRGARIAVRDSATRAPRRGNASGIGLDLAERIVRRHRGTLDMRHDDAGTVVEVRLPHRRLPHRKTAARHPS